MDTHHPPDIPKVPSDQNVVSFSEKRETAIKELEFIGGQRLLIERGEIEDQLTLLSPSGETAFSIRITPSGPVLKFETGLRIEAAGNIEFSAKRLKLSGAEGVDIRSGADASIEVAGDLNTTARIQNIKASLGNVNVKANDDVRLTGERVRLNC